MILNQIKTIYLLKNKDKTIAKFLYIQEQNLSPQGEKILTENIINTIIYDKFLLPKNLNINLETNEAIKEWIKKRKAPKNRTFIDKIKESYNDNSLMATINISFGLSLNDSFWILPKENEKNIKWKDHNLYENSFDKTLELVAFLGESHKVSGLTSSPEFTTGGMLKKSWHKNENGIIKLMKGSSQEYANGGKEAYAEFYMYQIANALNFKALKYDLEKFHNQIVSSCEIFTSQKIGYIPIYYCLKNHNKSEISLLEIKEIYGENNFENLMVFDAIIANADRHLGNFGMLYDNDTNEILKPAPIFDNGTSLLNLATIDDLKNIQKYIQEKKSYFDITFKEQLEKYLQPRHLKNIKNLTNFKFQKHPKYNLDEKWLKPVEKYLNEISIECIKIIKSKNLKQEIYKAYQNIKKDENNKSKDSGLNL